MARPGTRENPVDITAETDLERATRHVHRPSPDQASAGNYQKAHVSIGGLDITIENPKDSVRSGVGPDGTTWAVQMPAAYGYVKRTLGFDGDQLDVYLGPHSHTAPQGHVWIVDQCDCDTKEFDEHKVMIGFENSVAARDTYHAAFSDGRGAQRVMAVTKIPFTEFKTHLKGEWNVPFSRRTKSASVNKYNSDYSSTCPCHGPCGCSGFGGTMNTNGQAAAIDPKAASNVGFWTKFLGKALPGMSAEDRNALIQDAATQSTFDIGKASSLLEGEGIHQVQDLWDGPPDDRINIASASGPDSSMAPGGANVGPSQSASGNGAERMVNHYSRPAPQSGVQAATEKLGREVAGMRGAMKSMLRAFESVNTQFQVMKSGMVDTAAIQEMVSKAVAEGVAEAVAKALPEAVAKAVAEKTAGLDTQISRAVAKAVVKAASEEKDDERAKEDDESDDHMAKAASEKEDEGDDDSETAKSAAVMRLQAKSRAKWAARRANGALDAIEAGDIKAAGDLQALAEINIAKATNLVTAATTLTGRTGPSSKAILTAVAKAKECVAENQKKWPASKGDAQPVAQSTSTAAPDIAKAVEQIQAAASGMGMMTATVGELITAMSRGNAGNGSAALPPVFALAKSDMSAVAAVEKRLSDMAVSGEISDDDHDRARDVIMRSRMGMDSGVITAMVARLSPKAQAVLAPAA